MNPCQNREKVLLNLKWFVHRFIKSFESKLLLSVSCNANSTLVSPRETSFSSPTFSISKLNVDSNCLHNDSPLIRQLLEQQLKNNEKNRPNCTNSISNFDLTMKLNNQKRKEKSPRNKIRSLTNSPLFRRLSLSNNQNKRSSLLSTDEKYDYCNGDSTGGDDILDIIKIKTVQQDINHKRKCLSNTQSPVFIPFNYNINNHQKECLIHFYENSTENQRFHNLSYFAQQLCVIYEYQLGMLKSISSIYTVADYVAEVVLKALKLKKICDINALNLSPMILFYNDCKPNSYTKVVKTSPLAVTGEQLSWKLGDIWTLPGLRHNEVGGENCHNLNIVTHFLSSIAPTEGLSRSDTYGYRNLILLKSDAINVLEKLNNITNEKIRLPNTNQKCEEELQLDKMNCFFKISSFDYSTITNSKINAGNIQDNNLHENQLTPSNGTSNNIRNLTLKPHSPESRIKSKSKQIHVSSNAAMLRQHIHRAYRPVFFVIYNRPTVIEHLTECDSFATFCKRQSISPVMFLNQHTDIFNKKPYPCIYQNFDLFKVSVAGYVTKNDNEIQEFTTKNVFNFNDPSTSKETNGIETKNIAYFPHFNRRNASAYDNPGFAC